MRFIFNIFYSLLTEGITLMALLKTSAKTHPQRCALVAEGVRLNYTEMYRKAENLAMFLSSEYNISKGKNVAMLCRNHEWSTLLLFALSRLGVNVMLLNTDVCIRQITDILSVGTTDFLFFDEEYSDRLVAEHSTSTTFVSVEHLAELIKVSVSAKCSLPYIFRGGNITIFTGGSSGNYKAVTRQSRIFQFLPPLFALLRNIRIYKYQSVLVVLPYYHGFGFASLVVSAFLGKKICLMRHFHAEEVVKLIHDETVEALPVVPAMLSRMMLVPDASEQLRSIKCIICGGDILEKTLVDKVRETIGNVLFNLYGTSEVGFFMLASPSALNSDNEITLGKPILGVRCCIQNINAEGIGTLCMKPLLGGIWKNTGDLVWRNVEGYYFYRGRSDNMVVCGGENVYPEHLQRVLNEHTEIADSLVYPVVDVSFGKVLHAQVELKHTSAITEEEIRSWLRTRVSRAEMPHKILIGDISLLSTGKRIRKS